MMVCQSAVRKMPTLLCQLSAMTSIPFTPRGLAVYGNSCIPSIRATDLPRAP
jgi:hypothetical protein